jgi:hypothetical protein
MQGCNVGNGKKLGDLEGSRIGNRIALIISKATAWKVHSLETGGRFVVSIPLTCCLENPSGESL